MVESRISLSWMRRGQTNISMSLQSLPGLALGSLRSLTIGSDGWRPNIIDLRSSFSAGPFTDREAAGALRRQINFLTRLSVGLGTQIRGSERRGRRAKDWRSSSHIVELYLFWMAWSPSKIRPVHKKDGSAILLCRRLCANLPPSIRGFV